MSVTVEIYNVTARKLTYELPRLFSGMWSGDSAEEGASLPAEVVINETEPKAQFYNITVRGLTHVVDAYTAHLVVHKCASNVSTGKSTSESPNLCSVSCSVDAFDWQTYRCAQLQAKTGQT